MKIGDKVAWTLYDGNIMAGTVVNLFDNHAYVKRVDGAVCAIPYDRLRLATYDDIDAAIRFMWKYWTERGTRHETS